MSLCIPGPCKPPCSSWPPLHPGELGKLAAFTSQTTCECVIETMSSLGRHSLVFVEFARMTRSSHVTWGHVGGELGLTASAPGHKQMPDYKAGNNGHTLSVASPWHVASSCDPSPPRVVLPPYSNGKGVGHYQKGLKKGDHEKSLRLTP